MPPDDTVDNRSMLAPMQATRGALAALLSFAGADQALPH
jgi:hypothetical protein